MNETAGRFLAVVRGAAERVKRGDYEGRPEQSFREEVESALPQIFEGWGIEFLPSFERATLTERRIDMLCGRVITEYKAPGVLASDADYAEALAQAQDYVEQLAAEFNEPLGDYFGVVLDGFHVGFIHYDPELGWLRTDRQELDVDSVFEVLRRFRAHSKHPLDARKIAEALGPESSAAQILLPALVSSLHDPTGKTALLFSEWRRLFGQAVGTEAHQYPGVVDWASSLGVSLEDTEPETLARLFFSIHTYYAFAIKILTADIVTTIRTRSLAMFAQDLAATDREGRLEQLRELEENRIFEKAGIRNFMEGDFFSWYLDHYTNDVDEGARAVAESASRFEPATPVLSPGHITDLFKRLYQILVPERIRHDLGEFYTPDWLADYVLQRVGFSGEPAKRLLDPACGSGTFLIRALTAFKAHAHETGTPLTAEEVLAHVRDRNLAGFDLNPLAVVAARANFIVALVDELAHSNEPVSIPIYLADAIYSPELEGSDYVYRLETERGIVEMRFPEALLAGPEFDQALREIEGLMWEDGDKPHPNDLPDESPITKLGLGEFYQQIWELDEQDWNKIWCRVINNRFAAIQVGIYDYVVGNPPWVVWSNLPSSYRTAVKHVCDHYNIFSDDAWVGGIESDISTVLTYAAADRWLGDSGKLGFLITQSVFKTKSAQGFRRFRLPGGSGLRVLHVDDLTTIRPFEDAANRTAALFIRRGENTAYPVPYLVWKRLSRRHSISTSDPLASSNAPGTALAP